MPVRAQRVHPSRRGAARRAAREPSHPGRARPAARTRRVKHALAPTSGTGKTAAPATTAPATTCPACAASPSSTPSTSSPARRDYPLAA